MDEEKQTKDNEETVAEDEVSVKEDRVIPTVVEEIMKSSYLDYAMSVIVGRALPDVRDGLKPVHKRILYAMYDLGMLSNKPSKKCARIVGEVIGKYHPHGDVAVYDTLVRMAQDFSLRYPLITGQGNFGSIDGDSAAAMRYTEAKLSKVAEEMLEDIKKDTVDFKPNFDGELKEPAFLPAKIPNLLVNGSSGIAVGMATNIPPHNLIEVADATIDFIKNPAVSVQELIKHIKGPDFPTGGIICGTKGINDAYSTGRGKVKVRARIEAEEIKKKVRLLISEIPYQVNKSQLIEHIAHLVKEKVITGISDIRDESSDKDGLRVIIELKSEANVDIVKNQLFKHSKLESTFGIIMLGLVDNEPVILKLKDTIQHFVHHRQSVVRRRTQFDLRKAEERAHILEGLIIALDDIDNIVQKIKQAKDVETARSVLIADYSLTEIQAKAILDMRLQKLASLEQAKIKDEHKQLQEIIAELKEILANTERIDNIIIDELEDLKQKYNSPRRTEISHDVDTEIDVIDLIEEEDMVITVTHQGYIKRIPVDTYRKQGRGGKGVIGATKNEEDFVEHLFIASTHAKVLFFSDRGQVYWLNVYNIPQGSRQAKGKAIINLIGINKNERITAFVPVRLFDDSHYIVMATRKGTVKKTSLEQFSRPRKGGIKAINLNEGDSLIGVVMTDGSNNMIIATRKGMAVRFVENDIRPMGRAAAGVRGIKLKVDDLVVGMVKGEDSKTLFTITENGYGKRTAISEYRVINRGGVGVKNIICSPRNGCAVSIRSVNEEDELMFISQKGIIIRNAVKDISNIGRSTQGVRLMRLGEGDKVKDTAKIINE